MNVPNRYKGFSQLPENVQQRMDPSLAKKYQMGGSVMQRPLFRQMGGPTDMMPQDMMPPPPMAGAPMAPPPMAPPPMDPMAEQMMAAESMGESAGANVADAMMMQIDGAQDYESLIDGIRGNELPLDARYQELAGLVGEADAMATPESVLALTQPTIMMTEQGAMDSGIGELMQGIAGDVEMSGPMDDGVGSLMAAGAGNTPPVNFRNGGPVEVRGYSNGDAVISEAQAMLPQYQKFLAGDSAARAAELEEQRKMSQAQMLFDIAGAGLAFAGETQGGTAAERLANALSKSQLTDKIGMRAAGILDAERAQAAEDRQTTMTAKQTSLQQAISNKVAKDALDLANAKKTSKASNMMYLYTVDEEGVPRPYRAFDVNDDDAMAEYNILITPEGQVAAGVEVYDSEGIKPFNKAVEARLTGDIEGEKPLSEEKIAKRPFTIERNGKKIKVQTGEILFLTGTEFKNNSQNVQSLGSIKDRVTIYPVDGVGPPRDFPSTSSQLNKLLKEDGGYTRSPDAYIARLADTFDQKKESRAEVGEQKRWERNRDAKLKDVEAAIAAKIAEEERQLGRELNAEERAQITWTTRNTITKQQDLNRLAISQGLKDASQISKEERAAITAQNNFERDLEAKLNEELRAIENGATIELREVDGQLVKVDTLTGETSVLFGEADIPDRLMAQITLPNKDGVSIPVVIDINSPEGQDMLEQVNAANAVTPGSAGYQKVSTASTAVRGFFVEGEGVVTSFDGKTFINSKGEAENLVNPNKPERTVSEVSNTIAYDVYKNEKLSASAQRQLEEMDIKLVQGMTSIDGKALSKEQMSGVRDAYAAARIGTGFWSKVRAGIDAVAGGIISPEFFGDLFKETQDARQFIRMLRVMGRSALASSPKYAVRDLETVEQLFPNEQVLFSDPVSEANKLRLLSSALGDEKQRILLKFVAGGPMDSSMKGQLNQKLFEIDKLQGLLGPINLIGEASGTSEAVNNAVETMRKARQAAKDNEGGNPP